MIDTSLLAHLPPIRRARGDRLYADERHWVDLWKQGGAWLLGHRPEGAAHEWKNQIDKGLAAVFPTRWTQRLETHLSELLARPVVLRLFANSQAAIAALSSWKGQEFTFQDYQRARWRPWSSEAAVPRDPWAGITWPILPGGPTQAVALVLDPSLNQSAHPLPATPLISVAESAALVRAVVTLKRKLSESVVNAAVQKVSNAWDKHLGPSALFDRDGLWLRPSAAPEDYERLFLTFLEAGFVLSPDADQESLLPWDVSAGEWVALKAAAERFLSGDM